MKKTLQKTLAVIMVIAMIFTQMAIIASAAEPEIVGIAAVAQKSLIENYDGYLDYEEIYDEELGEWVRNNEYFRYNPSNAELTIKVTYSDGSSVTGTESEIFEKTGYWPDVYYSQTYEEQWGVGTHTCRIGIADVEGTFEVEVIENPVESFEVTPIKQFVENYHGFYTTSMVWSEDAEEYVESEEYFYYSPDYIGFRYVVTLKSGRVIDTESQWELYEALGYWVDIYSEQSYETQWGLGEHEFDVSFLGHKVIVPVEVIESPVQSITVTQNKEIVEQISGYYTTDSLYDDDDNYIGESDEYFRYNIDDDLFNFTVTYKDGRVFTGDRWDIYEETNEYLEIDDAQSFENQWTVGKNEITVNFLDIETKFNVVISESPIASIDVEDIVLIENTDGYWDFDWNEETEENDLEYFRYDVIPVYTVTMKDGTVYESDVDGDIYYDDSWVHMNCNLDQDYYNQLELGTYEVTGTLMGKTVTFNATIIDTPIESMTITPQRDLIIGWDDAEYFYEYNDFIAEIKFKDGSTDECLISDLYREYGYEFTFETYESVSDYVIAGTFKFMGYEGVFEVTFVENPYESISISGLNELIITLYKEDGTSEVATMLDYDWYMGDVGFAYGIIKTDKGIFPGGIAYAYDDEAAIEYPNKDIVITIGEMQSNTLETNNWYWAFSTSQKIYGAIYTYKELTCEEYYDREFKGLDIANSDYNVTDLANIAAYRMGSMYEYEDYEEEIDGTYNWFLVYDADDVVEMIEKIFNISNVDITECEGYNSEDNTVRIPWWGGVGDWADINYSLEYVDGKWHGTKEIYSYYTQKSEYTNVVLTDEMLVEKISFGKEEEIDTSLNGWKNEDGKWAFYVNGIKLKNQWKADSKGWCYLGEDGYMLTNALVKDSQGVCFVGSDGYIVYNKWVQFEGKWYFIDTKGYTVTNQWRKDSSGWCYLGSDGAMLTNEWVKDSKGWCYVSSNGYIVYNQWVNYGGKWYFVDANGYRVSNQWRKDSTGWCYLGSDGAMLTNAWVKDSKGYCYVGSNGYIVYNKWVSYDGKWYFVDANGYKVSSQWRKDSIGWCYLGSDGAMLTNKWVKDSKGWCYVDESGYIVYNQWINDGGKSYYIDANGYMVSNKWLKDGDNWRYVGADGSCLTNQWMKDSIGWCFLDENGYMVTNAMVTDSYGICFVGEDGYWQSNVIIDDGSGYLYFDETGYLATDVIVHDGYGYRYFDETGYMVTDTWLTIDGESVYVDSNGYLDIQ